jgi:hypothetical protein
MKGITLVSALLLSVSVSAQEVAPLPPPVTAEHTTLQLRGKKLFTYFGFKVYNAFLWTTQGTESLKETFALDLNYLRNFTSEALSQRSIDEMVGQGVGNETQHAKWMEDMKRVFPNVKPGDRITGLSLPGKMARFYHNGKHTGDVNDPAFADAFFGIWLHPKTSQPELRKALLAQ